MQAEKFKVNGMDPTNHPECEFSQNADTGQFTATFAHTECGVTTSANETDLIYSGRLRYSTSSSGGADLRVVLSGMRAANFKSDYCLRRNLTN